MIFPLIPIGLFWDRVCSWLICDKASALTVLFCGKPPASIIYNGAFFENLWLNSRGRFLRIIIPFRIFLLFTLLTFGTIFIFLFLICLANFKKSDAPRQPYLQGLASQLIL